MAKITIPAGYKNPLTVYETQCAIEFIKKVFQDNLTNALNLHRVSAPLFVEEDSGLNDNLNGYERPVSFDIPDVGTDGSVVHSLAKWKRYALKRYGFEPGKGLYTDMDAIRRDEELDNIHSVYVDQWDWERIITPEERNPEFLFDIVQRIVNCLYVTNEMLKIQFPQLHAQIPRELKVVTTQELEDMFPELESGSARETALMQQNKDKAVFLTKIGCVLRSGRKHDGRAPDYDDWELNGDILYWNETLQRSFEISSMGIRVNEESMDRQLRLAGCDNRRKLPFHKALLAGELPLTIGGGIGQSRVCMLMLGSAHIGEVQCSIWDKETEKQCREAGIVLL